LKKTEVKMEVKKVIRDGLVAVLYSPGFGAGWSTWAHSPLDEVCLYDPLVVAWVEGGKVGPVPIAHYGDEYFYAGGADDLVIAWLPVGTAFVVNEYDGSESLRLKEDDIWNVA
jgi:hypothetical protein